MTKEVLSLLLFIAFASPSYGDESVDNYITMVLINFSEAMRTGVPVLGIPVLDPFYLRNVTPPAIDTKPHALEFRATDNVLTGHSYYVPFVHIEFADQSNHIRFNFDKIKINGDYWIDGLLYYVLPVFGMGRYNVEMQNIMAEAIGGIAITPNGYLQLTDNIELGFTFGDLVIHLDNFLGGGSFGDEMNEAVSDIMEVIIRAKLPEIEEQFIHMLIRHVNAELMKYSLKDIIKGSIPKLILN